VIDSWTPFLGNLSVTELNLVGCLCIVLGMLAAHWRTRRELESQLRRLDADFEALVTHVDDQLTQFDKRIDSIDPKEVKARDEGLANNLRSLLALTQAIKGRSNGELESNAAHSEERS